MSDLKHLTHDEGHALAAFRAGLNCDEEVEQVFKALAELRARHEKLRKLVARRLGLIPPCLEIEEHAELNALLEDE